MLPIIDSPAPIIDSIMIDCLYPWNFFSLAIRIGKDECHPSLFFRHLTINDDEEKIIRKSQWQHKRRRRSLWYINSSRSRKSLTFDVVCYSFCIVRQLLSWMWYVIFYIATCRTSRLRYHHRVLDPYLRIVLNSDTKKQHTHISLLPLIIDSMIV